MALHLSNARGRNTRSRPAQSKPTGQSPYEVVTAQIVKALEEGVVPWRKPWQVNSALPCNAVSHRSYHGINLFLLSLSRYSDHRWLTYRQAEEFGGHVRPKEQSSIAVFWKQWEPSEDATDEAAKPNRKRIPLLRYYHLFNVAQCEDLKLPELEVVSRPRHQRITEAEAFVQAVPNLPPIREDSKLACYSPAFDVVAIPPLDAFDTADAYYAALFHELGHATGHQTRLNRPGTDTPRFGSADYSREELVAELASGFCCATIGLDNSLIDNAASYIQGWLTALKADTKAIIAASTQAQRAADYLRGLLPGESQSDLSATSAAEEVMA